MASENFRLTSYSSAVPSIPADQTQVLPQHRKMSYWRVLLNHADISVSKTKIGQILKGLNPASPDNSSYNQCFISKYSSHSGKKKKKEEKIKKEKKVTVQKNPTMHVMPLLSG